MHTRIIRADRSGATRAGAALPGLPACLLAGLFAAGCAGVPGAGSPVERAIEARGGPLQGFARTARARVYYGFPGEWRWEMAFRAPDRYRFSLVTEGPDQHYVYDGRRTRAFAGSAPIPVPEPIAEAFRSHVRWIGVISLDVLSTPRVRYRTIPASELPRGVASGIHAWFTGPETGADRGFEAGYDLFFDGDGRLIRAEGPISIPGIGAGRLQARFSDFRPVEGYRLPFHTEYVLNDERFFDEEVTRLVPNPGPGAIEPPGVSGAGSAAPPGPDDAAGPADGTNPAEGRARADRGAPG